MFRKTFGLILALPLALAACDEGDTGIKFGAKNFTESRILAEMMAAMAEEQGLKVAGVFDYPDTPSIMAAIKAGDIDAYPDYNGTGLVMLGQNPVSDGDEAQQRVSELFQPLGLTWLGRFGFANNYGLALRADRASEMGVTVMSDLVARAGRMTIAIEDDFQNRPLDGFSPMNQRYGFEFGEVEVIALDDRLTLFDTVISGDADLIEVYTTDGQIAEYNMVVLEDDLGFFPVYQAAPVVRADTLSAREGLGNAIGALAGKIDGQLMQELNGKVDIEGRSARAVARDALARLGLIDAGAVEAQDPLVIASEIGFATSSEAPGVLRAVQKAFTGRDVQIDEMAEPLLAVASGDARVALVAADAFYDVSAPSPTRTDQFEAVAAVGQSVVHVLAKRDGVTALADAKTVAVGPASSSSARIGTILVSGLGLSAQTAGVEGGIPNQLAEVRAGNADVAVIVAPAGHPVIADAMQVGGVRLLSIEGWNEGSNLVRYPFLREARIAGRTYRGQGDAVETLRAQLVLAGPAPQGGDAIGDRGPAAVTVEAQPITPAAVKELNENLTSAGSLDPAMRISAALAPTLPKPSAAINPAADISILSLALVAFFVWLFWLMIRPEYR